MEAPQRGGDVTLLIREIEESRTRRGRSTNGGEWRAWEQDQDQGRPLCKSCCAAAAATVTAAPWCPSESDRRPCTLTSFSFDDDGPRSSPRHREPQLGASGPCSRLSNPIRQPTD